MYNLLYHPYQICLVINIIDIYDSQSNGCAKRTRNKDSQDVGKSLESTAKTLVTCLYF